MSGKPLTPDYEDLLNSVPDEVKRLYYRAIKHVETVPYFSVNRGMLLSALMTFYQTYLETMPVHSKDDLTAYLVDVYRNMKPFYVAEGEIKPGPINAARGMHLYMPAHCFLANELIAINTFLDPAYYHMNNLQDTLVDYFFNIINGKVIFSHQYLKSIIQKNRKNHFNRNYVR